jgi:hypothetical protein
MYFVFAKHVSETLLKFNNFLIIKLFTNFVCISLTHLLQIL